MGDEVTIKEAEYLRLIGDSAFLECLMAAGVDNWDGYDEAVELFENKEDHR